MARAAVFFDRDGVLNKTVIRDGRPHPPRDVTEFAIEDGAEEALRALALHIPLMLVVSNQPDVARGTQKRETVEHLNSIVMQRLPIAACYVCYHDEDDCCACRKPAPGLLEKAAQDHQIDLSCSYMVGDRWRDVEAGVAAGCTTILIERDYHERRASIEPARTVRTVREAVDTIIRLETDHYTEGRKGETL